MAEPEYIHRLMDTSKQDGGYCMWCFLRLLNQLGIIRSITFDGSFEEPYDPRNFCIEIKQQMLL